VEILLKFQNIKSPCANVKTHIVTTFWRRFWFKFHMLSSNRFVATCVRFLAVWKSNKRANREPSSWNHLGAYYVLLDVFCSCVSLCEIFTSVGSESQRGPHVAL